jgi:hypothetical protein
LTHSQLFGYSSINFLPILKEKRDPPFIWLFICDGMEAQLCFQSIKEGILKNLRLILFAAVFIALSASHLSAQSGTTYRDGPRITCASDDGNRHYCAADTRYGVRMVNQRSGSPCKQGYSWGYDRRGIWVDRGCRADFIVRVVYAPPPPPRPPVPGGGVITCSSDNWGRQFCPADTRYGVRMVNQRSGSPCRKGYSWDYDRRGIWVDRGCRADFALGR